jgi:hypothetical protein
MFPQVTEENPVAFLKRSVPRKDDVAQMDHVG